MGIFEQIHGWTKRRLQTCDFGLFPHIMPQTEITSLCTTPRGHTHTHTESGLAVNSAGNIICWGTAAGSLHRQNGRVGSLSQTQTTPNTCTRFQGSTQRERLSPCLVCSPISASQSRSMLGRQVTPRRRKTGRRDAGCRIEPRKRRIRV